MSGVLPAVVRHVLTPAVCDEQTAAAKAKKPQPMLVGRVARKAAPSVDGVMPPSDDDEDGHNGDDEAR